MYCIWVSSLVSDGMEGFAGDVLGWEHLLPLNVVAANLPHFDHVVTAV